MNLTKWLLTTSLLATCFPALAPFAGQGFDETAAKAGSDLEGAKRELAALREEIAAEKVPLNRRLNELERERVRIRGRLDDTNRRLDTTNLELTNLQNEVQGLQDEKAYLANLLDEYVRNLETRVHITELQRYRDKLETARAAGNDAEMLPADVFRIQTAAVESSIDRLDEVVGGTTFAGTAVGAGGIVKDAQFALLGPVAFYRATDASSAGLVDQRLGSLEPNMIQIDDPVLSQKVADLVANGSGTMALDPTLGNAQKVEASQDSIQEHVIKGGPVMVPILLLAGSALIVALLKWFQLARVRKPNQKRVDSLLATVKQGDFAGALTKARTIGGPTGEMLTVGCENLTEPKELVEELMFERTLETRLRLQSFLSFVAISAAAAPLLGLLGTVTGIINTFKLITVFGTGDAKTLSSGISEALITTEFGLIVAIPSLLLHAYLSRKSRRLIDSMEKTAISFLNRIPSASGRPVGGRLISGTGAAAADGGKGSSAGGWTATPPLPAEAATDH